MPTDAGKPSLRFRGGFRVLGAVVAVAGALYVGLGLSGSGAGATRSELLAGFGVACLLLGGFLWWWTRR